MATRRVADGSSLIEDINSGEEIKDNSLLTDDRTWDTYYNLWGDERRFPSDPVQAKILNQQGWSLFKPPSLLPRPTQQRMRDGTIYDFSVAANDLSEGERQRMDRGPVSTGAVAPTATYYSANGDKLEGLPADPESMKQYFELGLSLTPPVKSEDTD